MEVVFGGSGSGGSSCAARNASWAHAQQTRRLYHRLPTVDSERENTTAKRLR